MITLKNVSYGIGDKTILNQVSFVVDDGEKVGLVGLNGAGKSTLFHLILGDLIPEKGSIYFSKSSSTMGYMPQTVSEIQVPKDQRVFDFLLSGRPVKQIEEEIQRVADQLSGINDEKEMKNVLGRLGQLQEKFEFFGGYGAEDELLKILDGFHLDGIDLDAKVGTLSGGQKSKVNFSRVLYSRSDALLLDEPTNHLDKKSREWLIGFLKTYPNSALIISHDRRFLDETVTKIVRLDEHGHGADIFNCNYTQHLAVVKQRQEAEQNLVANHERKIHELQTFVEKMKGVSGKRKRQASSREKALKKMLAENIQAKPESRKVRVKLSPKRDGSNPFLNANKVHFAYLPGEEVISGISFSILPEERFAIVGKNGAGKSTLLKLIAGILHPRKGEILVGAKTDINYYAQEHEAVDDCKTLIEEMKTVSDLPQHQLRSVLAQFLFSGDSVFQKVATLSPGELSRLALAKLSLLGGNLLLLDEPTNHLDCNTSLVIAQTLREYGGSIIVVSHDADFLEALGVERMLLLPQGKVRYYNRSLIEQFSSKSDQRR